MKISEIITETTSAGGIAVVATPVGGMQKRPNPSVFSKKKKKKTSERKLSKSEIKKRDEYADDLPDAEFKKRYGDDWEAVKYGTATKMAKKKKNESLTEEQFDEAAGEKDACYYKVKSRYKVWPSAYASGALVKCRKVGAKNWGNKSKKKK